jgi:hypothetical protein
VLPPFIIEQIRQREERERARQDEQPRLELPIPRRPHQNRAPVQDADEGPGPDRGVVILDIT